MNEYICYHLTLLNQWAPEELTNVKGIGQKTLDKNKKDILISDTPAVEPATFGEPNKDNKPN